MTHPVVGPPDRNEIAPSRFNRDLPGTRLLFAPGAVLELSAQLASLGLRRAFVVTTGGRSAALVPPQELLGDLLVEVFSAAREHVPVGTIAKALRRVQSKRPDVCVAIGGGSAIGLGKAIARATGLPLVAIPTTYSGSEMTSIWGETDAAGKRTGRDPKAKPRLVIYDVTLTFGFPADMSAASGMNAMAHAVEAMYSNNASDATRDMAEEAASLLAHNLANVVVRGTDLISRTRVLIGAHLAGRALDESSMGLHHRICHVLGGTFNLPHARTHAVMLPHVVAYNAPAAPEAMRRIGLAIDSPNDVAAGLSDLNQAIGITATLATLGFKSGDVDRAADEITAIPYPNPRPATRDDVKSLLSAALSSAYVARR